MRWKRSRRSAGGCPSSPANVRMSPPAMKCLPAPRRTTTRSASSSATSAVRASSASTIAKASMLSTSGRLRVIVATGPTRSNRIGSLMGRFSLACVIARFPERACRFELADRVRDIGAFLFAERRDGGGKVGIRNRVRGERSHRHQPARKLVHPLRAAGEAADTPFDAKLDRLVIAGFEMEARHISLRTPVTAPERPVIENIERRADRTSFLLADDQQQMLRHRGGDTQEKFRREIRRRVMRPIRRCVAVVEECPVAVRDLASDNAPEDDAGVPQPPPLLLHLLALVVVERREIVVEIAITGVLPFELNAVADDHSCASADVRFLRRRTENVQRR